MSRNYVKNGQNGRFYNLCNSSVSFAAFYIRIISEFGIVPDICVNAHPRVMEYIDISWLKFFRDRNTF